LKTIVGLGPIGFGVVKEFAKIGMKSNFICFDDQEHNVDNKLINFIKVPSYNTSEEYESNFPSIKKYIKKLKGELLFVVSGGSDISLSSLAILEQLKNDFSISVLYVKPEIDLLRDEDKAKERLVYGVLQEYARSGLFEAIFLISSKSIDVHYGGIPILLYQDKINETIASAYYIISNLQNSRPVFDVFHKIPIGARIATFGFFDKEMKEERVFFDVDNVTDSVYYFGYSEESLKNNSNTMNEIRSFIKERNEEEQSSRVSYGVYATSYEHNFVYCLKYTSIIQK